MNAHTFFVGLGTAAGMVLLTGCFQSKIQVYPVDGPLAARKPLPVILGEKTGLNSGTLSLVLPGGERCSGPWSFVEPVSDPGAGGVVDPPAEHELAAAWDAVYGPGFHRAHVLGARERLRSKLEGDRGAVLFVEMTCGEGSLIPRLGVAQDGSGNTFKVLGPKAFHQSSSVAFPSTNL